MASLEYLNKFWRTVEISLINFEINLILTWPSNCVIKPSAIDQAKTLTLSDAKLYVPLVNLSTKGNPKLFQQSKLVLKEQLTGISINLK